jgi:GTPase SAR1 family protein
MKKNVLASLLLLFFVTTFSGLVLFAQESEPSEEIVEEEVAQKIISEFQTDYSEMNALIDGVIFQKLSEFADFCKKYLLIALAFFLSWPVIIKNIIFIAMFPAVFGIVASHVIGIYKNRNEWQKYPYLNIMYSYFIKSGTLQRKKSYKEAHVLLRDHTWFLISFAGLAYRLGNFTNKSTLLMFLCSFVYLPMAVLGIIEMILRIIFGTICLVIFNLLHQLILLITKLISYVMIPISFSIDKVLQLTQYCPHCYETFEFPDVVCPSCGTVHKKLIPGKFGVLFVRCGCNKKCLPCTSFTGRQNLASRCPSCGGSLAAGNAKHFSITVIGGNHSGKTAFLSSFSNIYINKSHDKKRFFKVTGQPENYFNELNGMFDSGKTESDVSSRSYSLVHTRGKANKDNLVFYDTRDEEILSDTFPRSPKYFGFSDGIILVLDPLSTQSVQNKLAKINANITSSTSDDDLEKLVVQFIRQFTTIRGSSAGKMSNTPIAILINKIDVDIVKQELGENVINTLCDEQTMNDKCREYLIKIGLINVLNNIEAAFTEIGFFPVSTIGHAEKDGMSFAPIGVIDPVLWLARKCKSNIANTLSKAKK